MHLVRRGGWRERANKFHDRESMAEGLVCLKHLVCFTCKRGMLSVM